MPRIGEQGDGIDGDIPDDPFNIFLTLAARVAIISLAGRRHRVNDHDVNDAVQISYIKLRTRVSNKWGGQPDLIIADAMRPPPHDDEERVAWVLARLDHSVGEAVMDILCKRLRNEDGDRVYVPRHPNIDPTATAGTIEAKAAPGLQYEEEGEALLGTPGLTSRQRAILKGRIDGLTHGQIAGQMGIGIDIVKGEWASIKGILAAILAPTPKWLPPGRSLKG